jgi:hypothetical protein
MEETKEGFLEINAGARTRRLAVMARKLGLGKSGFKCPLSIQRIKK